MDRRQFLRQMLALAGTGFLAVGAADAILEEMAKTGAPPVSRSVTSTSSTATSSVLPDYQDFLSWLSSVSGPYKGTTLNISLEAEFVDLALQLRGQDFKNASGITDQYALLPYAQQLGVVSLLIDTQASTYDAFSVDNQNLGAFTTGMYSIGELAETYPDLTYPGLDLNGFQQFLWDNVAQYPPDNTVAAGANSDNAYLLPLDVPMLVQFYRTDVWSRLGLSLPLTWDDYFDDVKAISANGEANGGTPFGAVSMAAPDVPIVYEFLVHLTSFGGALWDFDGNNLVPTLNTDDAVSALENFVRLEPYSDPASYTYYWSDLFSSLASNVAATGLLWHDYLPWFNDPARTVIPGRMSAKANPAGPSGSFSTIDAAGMGVSKYSKNPEAAWLWLQWATALGTQETLFLDQYQILPTRPAAFSVPQIATAFSSGSYAIPSLAKSIFDSGGGVALSAFPKWYQALQVISYHLNQAWQSSESPSVALNNAQTQTEALGTLTF